jgi:RNA-directed DNA polymerase
MTSHWLGYVEEIGLRVSQKRLSQVDADLLIRYGESIVAKGAVPIFDARHLSVESGFELEFLYSAAYASKLYYRRFQIKKRSGGAREIAEPLPDLKAFQRWMLSELIGDVKPSKYAKAYNSNNSIKTHARLHVNRDVVISLDIKDFFGSLKVGRIYQFFHELGYEKSVSSLLASLCTLDGSLPQGAPTSAAISNLVLFDFDERVGGIAQERGLRYSRYADDMVFSGSGDFSEIIGIVRSELRRERLRLNDKKTKIMRRGSRQVTCGIILNDTLAPPRDALRRLRQEAYYIGKFGLDDHAGKSGNRLAELYGSFDRARWILQVGVANEIFVT